MAYLGLFAAQLSCQFPIGSWTIKTYFDDLLAFSHSWKFAHNPYGNVTLGISSPLVAVDSPLPALIDLAADHNYTATDAACPGSPNPNTTSPNLT